MKRYIHKVNPIYGGISVENDTVIFNWNKDTADDVLLLDDDTSGQSNIDNFSYVYGYRFNNNCSLSDKALIRNYLKHADAETHLFDADIDKFVYTGILRLDKYKSLSSFTAKVSAKSTSSYALIDLIDEYLDEYCRCLEFSFNLIKSTYEHVQFNADKAKQALLDAGYTEVKADKEIAFTLSKFANLKKSNELFQMKRFIPKEIRSGFYDFLSFETENEKQLYMKLQGVDVLVYDDFLTSGSTIAEMHRYLTSINNNNTLTAFVLVKQ